MWKGHQLVYWADYNTVVSYYYQLLIPTCCGLLLSMTAINRFFFFFLTFTFTDWLTIVCLTGYNVYISSVVLVIPFCCTNSMIVIRVYHGVWTVAIEEA